MINVLLNGELVTLQQTNLLQALNDWQYTQERCAVAINGEFVSRTQYGATQLNENDEVEVVSAVGGG